MFGINKNVGLSVVYGFMDPYLIHFGNKFDDTQTLLISRSGMFSV